MIVICQNDSPIGVLPGAPEEQAEAFIKKMRADSGASITNPCQMRPAFRWHDVPEMSISAIAEALAAQQQGQAGGGEVFGWWMTDFNGVGRFVYGADPACRQHYETTPGYSARALYTAPPSAPVGVEGLAGAAARCLRWLARTADTFEDAAEAEAHATKLEALTQQPAADNVPKDAGRVAVHFLARIFAAQEIGTDGEYRGWKISGKGSLNEVVAEARAWLAGQQPAAVDEFVTIDGKRYAIDTVRTALLGLASALAAQPGGVE